MSHLRAKKNVPRLFVMASLVPMLPAGWGCGEQRGQQPEGCVSQVSYRDEDRDGYGRETGSVRSCEPPAGYVSEAGDCDDTDHTVHPGALDVCDAAQKDDDCDGIRNNPPGGCACLEEERVRCYPDADGDKAFSGTSLLLCPGDGGGCPASPMVLTRNPPELAAQDCDDERPEVHPGALELCADRVDNDCNGEVDDRPLTDFACRLTEGPGSWCRPEGCQRTQGQLALGNYHSCFVSKSGRTSCWGRGTEGQLGIGQLGEDCLPAGEPLCCPSPRKVDLAEVAHLAAGALFSLGLTRDGSLYSWGDNDLGQLGTVDQASTTTPRKINLEPVVHVAAGPNHVCALTASGSLYCWGANRGHALGVSAANEHCPADANGEVTHCFLPERVDLEGVVDVALGWLHTCAVFRSGFVSCWGNNDVGQLGIGLLPDNCVKSDDEEYCPAPQPLELRDVRSVVAGWVHTCALKTDGSVFCWGANDSGQLGLGRGSSSEDTPQPVEMKSGEKIVQLTAGLSFTCALNDRSSASCWGINNYGQHGAADTKERRQPGDPVALEGILSMEASGVHACAVTESEGAFCWGWNSFGQSGKTPSSPGFFSTEVVRSPTRVDGLSEQL